MCIRDRGIVISFLGLFMTVAYAATTARVNLFLICTVIGGAWFSHSNYKKYKEPIQERPIKVNFKKKVNRRF